MKKEFLLSLGTVIIGSFAVFGFSSQASALSDDRDVMIVDVEAGPIYNNDDAKVKCPQAAARKNGVWNGQWRTTVPGRMSVCGVIMTFYSP